MGTAGVNSRNSSTLCLEVTTLMEEVGSYSGCKHGSCRLEDSLDY